MLGAVVIMILTACLNPVDSEEPSGPSVENVEQATLTASVTPNDDLASIGGDTAVSDKDSALMALLQAMQLGGANMSDFLASNPSWEPASGAVTTVPSDLFERDQPPEEFSVTSTLPAEVIDFALKTTNEGQVTGSGSADVEVTLDLGQAESIMERVIASATLDEIGLTVTGDTPISNSIMDASIPAGKLLFALNLNVDIDPTYDEDNTLVSAEIAYSVSAVVEFAFTLESTNSADPVGSFVATLTVGDAETLALDDALLADPNALSAYLEQKLNLDELSFTIVQHENDLSGVAATHSYTLDDLLAFFESAGT